MRKIRKRTLLTKTIAKEMYEDIFNDPYDYVCHSELIKVLIENDDLNYIVKHFDSLCKSDYEYLKPLLDYLKFNTFRIKDNDVLEKLKGSLIYHMLYETVIVKDEDIDRIRFIFNELAKNENESFFEIREISAGSFSTVYRLGNKVIKIGRRRASKIIDNSRILLPDQLLNIAGNTIEITDYVKDVGIASIEETYEVYKDLRDQGIIWMDPYFLNIGKLDRTTIESQNEKAKHKDKMPFLVENRKFKHRELKTNDLVIIDLDHLILEEDKKMFGIISRNISETREKAREGFEKRYLLEKKKAI